MVSYYSSPLRQAFHAFYLRTQAEHSRSWTYQVVLKQSQRSLSTQETPSVEVSEFLTLTDAVLLIKVSLISFHFRKCKGWENWERRGTSSVLGDWEVQNWWKALFVFSLEPVRIEKSKVKLKTVSFHFRKSTGKERSNGGTFPPDGGKPSFFECTACEKILRDPGPRGLKEPPLLLIPPCSSYDFHECTPFRKLNFENLVSEYSLRKFQIGNLVSEIFIRNSCPEKTAS